MSHTGGVFRSRVLVVALGAALFLGACGGGRDDADAEPTATAPAGLDLPDGVTLTEPGTTLDVGEPATFVYELDAKAASAVTATVRSVKKGSIDDFTFFTLDAKAKASTPYYVVVSLTNEGPAGIGGVAPPFVMHDDQNTIAPPNTLNGRFAPCKVRTLPDSLLPGTSVDVCMVFLVPEGRRLVTIDSQADDPGSAIRWKP